MGTNNVVEKVFGEFSLRDIEHIFTRITKYNYGMTYTYPDELVNCIRVHEGWDTERGTSEKSILVFRYPDTERHFNSEVWQAEIQYETTWGDEYDFIATVRSDMSTAYKSRPSGPPHEVKMILTKFYFYSFTNAREMAQSDLLHLSKLYDYLDKSTSTIEDWAASGLDMVVICNAQKCYRTVSTIPSKTISEYAGAVASLADLGNRLTCTHCGKRNPVLRPMPTKSI